MARYNAEGMENRSSVRFPSIKDVASCLIEHKRWLDRGDETEVRLQVTEDGTWIVRSGDPSFDQDHRGFWGSGYLTLLSNCRQLAYEMLEEAKDQEAMERS